MKTTFVSLQVVQGNQFLQLLKKANKILQAVSKRFLTLFTSHKSVTIELVTFRSRKPIIAKKKKNVTFRFLSSPILTQIEIIIFQSKIVVDRSYFFIFVCYFFFQFLLGKLLSMLLFILSCRLELTAYYRKRTFSNSQATLHFFSEKCVTYHSRSPFNDTAQYISYKHDMHEPIRYVLDHLDE